MRITLDADLNDGYKEIVLGNDDLESDEWVSITIDKKEYIVSLDDLFHGAVLFNMIRRNNDDDTHEECFA